MRKTLFVVLVALMGLGTQQAKAQIDFGIVAGMNVSKADFKNVGNNFDSSNRVGWFVGPKVEFTVPLLGIGADASVQYSQRTLNVEGDVADKSSRIDKNYHLHTIEVPVNLRYQFGLKSLAAIYVATGPQFGFNIGSGNLRGLKADDYKFKNSILTWNIGAGIKLLKHFEAGVGYNIALSKFTKGKHGAEEGSLKSNTFQAHVGYFF